ncbi:MAG: sugar ABC transporter permease [Blautia sp.]|nr:sugar ABC transporter permease [Blautia sp.]
MSTKALTKTAVPYSEPDTLINALSKGGPVVWASCLVMGLSHILTGRFVIGLIFLAIEIGVIAYMVIPSGGLYWLSMMPSLGTVEQSEVWNDDLGIYEYVAGDNSQQILLYAVATLVLLILFVVIWRASVRGGYKSLSLKKNGQKVPTFMEDLKSLLNSNIHKLLMTPPFAMLLVFTITPLAYMMLMAFTNYSKEGNHLILFDWVGLENFISLFDNGSIIGRQFWDVLIWTLIWAFFATFLNFFLGTIMAMIIERPTTRCKGLWRTILSLTIAVPQFVSLMIISTMFKDNGAANKLLQSLGLIGQNVNLPFWTDATWARVTIIVVNIWVGIPYTVMSVTGILKNIPAEQYEAARIDGATAAQQFLYVTLPYMFFVMTPTLITSFTGNINNFNVIFLLSGGGPTYVGDTAGQTDLLVTWLYKLTVDKQQYNAAAVIGIMTFIILAFVSLVTYRNTASYKDEGAFK